MEIMERKYKFERLINGQWVFIKYVNSNKIPHCATHERIINRFK